MCVNVRCEHGCWGAKLDCSVFAGMFISIFFFAKGHRGFCPDDMCICVCLVVWYMCEWCVQAWFVTFETKRR